ncbi:hypothetical protein ACIQYS_05415 [Psychrobacillus sp. NPDC096426]|uniref:hypothetical protein n=1 Tax=Psychrobacillus sp. NPDC096426 TaxID=3364491 RepID=UPI00382A2775
MGYPRAKSLGLLVEDNKILLEEQQAKWISLEDILNERNILYPNGSRELMLAEWKERLGCTVGKR